VTLVVTAVMTVVVTVVVNAFVSCIACWMVRWFGMSVVANVSCGAQMEIVGRKSGLHKVTDTLLPLFFPF
jgi:SNF family Na+-dependent transporter